MSIPDYFVIWYLDHADKAVGTLVIVGIIMLLMVTADLSGFLPEQKSLKGSITMPFVYFVMGVLMILFTLAMCSLSPQTAAEVKARLIQSPPTR